MRLNLSLACGSYDRTRPILDGSIGIDGCEVNAHALTAEETFFRSFRHAEFDVAELSFSTYLILTAQGKCPYVAVPAFLSRSFRHSGIYVREDSQIENPADLKGRRFGVPEYQVTAAAWTRLFLEQEYGLKPSDVTWVTGGVEEPGRHEKTALNLPSDVRVEAAPEGRTLIELLEAGEIDALTCPRAPLRYGKGIKRLFADSKTEAANWYRAHGHFPIMHVVGVRKELVAANPWLPSSVFKAFEQARRQAWAQLSDTTALSVMLPWLIESFEETKAFLGPDYWSYGVPENRKTIDAFLDAHHAQGLSARRLAIEEVFHPSTLEQVKL